MAVTLETLPTELKTRIAEVCSQADASWKACKAAIQDNKDVEERIQELLLDEKIHGRSLEALSRVSKNWRLLCGPLFFHVSPLSELEAAKKIWLNGHLHRPSS